MKDLKFVQQRKVKSSYFEDVSESDIDFPPQALLLEQFQQR